MYLVTKTRVAPTTFLLSNLVYGLRAVPGWALQPYTESGRRLFPLGLVA